MTNARDTYLGASIATASPARLLVMLLDRLVLDVNQGLDAQRRGAHEEAHHRLVHAQDIVMELRTTLKVDLWDGGPTLAALYDFIHHRLVVANATRNASITEECLPLVTDLAATWREAAMQSVAAAG
ncbi:flagellar export chaperone FliS [Nocardioides sp. SYSU DS0663]|uniref:flagellar export chaperone FliS n=1 Tax=Nocardioides sp. SYSU DS0663 TaxID=3416445 RepID=UPI003F4BF0A6